MLVALDRQDGTVLWKKVAKERFNCKALAASDSMVFCIDSISPLETEKWMRRGEGLETVPSTIIAINVRTGEVEWTNVTENAHGAHKYIFPIRGKDDWLAYSRQSGLLLTGKNGKGHAFAVETGEIIWAAKDVGEQPMILAGDTFRNQAGNVFDILSGEMNSDTIVFHRGGCNYAVAGKYLGFIRDKTVCYVDLSSGKSHYLRNIRSGCSASLIPADGLLNAPNFSSGCMCNYPIQTSLALIHMPEAEAWKGSVPTKITR